LGSDLLRIVSGSPFFRGHCGLASNSQTGDVERTTGPSCSHHTLSFMRADESHLT